MYRILIVDDEPIVREGISSTIDWNAHGFELVGACKDGREGLQAFETLKPDVVITDICMPFVDGLELAAWIGEEHPNVRTILLTGHDEFDYAQEAVRLHVRDFLLKPITANELRSVLDDVKRDLDGEVRRREEQSHLEAQLAESVPLLRERFLNRLIRGHVLPADANRRRNVLEIDLSGNAYAVALCDLDSPDGGDELSGIALTRIAADSAGNNAAVFSTPDEESVLVVAEDSFPECAARVLSCAEEVSRNVTREMARSVSIGIGKPVARLEEIERSYREAKSALERRFVLGSTRIITTDEARGSDEPAESAGRRAPRDRFVRSIRTGAALEARDALTTLVNSFEARGVDRDACLVSMQRLLADTLSALEELGVDYRRVEHLGTNPFERLSALKTLRQMESWFLETEKAIRSTLEHRRDDHSRRKAVAAEAYIREHFNENNLSLSRVCSALSVSKSYLSPVFKAHTGVTFVEYLTKTRMDRACELLAHGNLRTYEVAEEVGFRDAHYFSVTFRKQTGVTPTEYRARAREGTA